MSSHDDDEAPRAPPSRGMLKGTLALTLYLLVALMLFMVLLLAWREAPAQVKPPAPCATPDNGCSQAWAGLQPGANPAPLPARPPQPRL